MIMGAAGERFAKQSKLSIYLLPGLALLGWKSCGYSVMEEMGAGSLCPTSRRPEIGSGELVAQEDRWSLTIMNPTRSLICGLES